MGLLNSEVIRDEIFNRGVGGLAEIIAKKILYEGELSARDSDILAGVLEFINSPEGKMTKDQIKQSVAYDLDRIIKEKARRDIEAEEIRKKDIYLNYLAEFKDKGVNLSKIPLNFTVTILCNFKTRGSYTYSVSTTSKRIELISRGSGIFSLVNETEDINNLRLSRDMDIFLGSYIPEDGEMKLLPTLKRNSTLEIVFLARGDKEANAKTGRTSSELKVQDVIVEEVSGYKGLEPKSR